jgi:hypothetical protein
MRQRGQASRRKAWCVLFAHVTSQYSAVAVALQEVVQRRVREAKNARLAGPPPAANMRAARAQGRTNNRSGTGAERVHGEAKACDGAVEYGVVAASGNKLAVGDVLGELVVHPALHTFWLGVGL